MTLDEGIKHCEEVAEYMEPLYGSTCFCRQLAEWLKQVPRWISVKDRLPEPKKDVLVYSEIEHPHKIRVDFLKASGQWFNSFHVTHWMPLPTPPEKPYEEWDRIAKERDTE